MSSYFRMGLTGLVALVLLSLASPIMSTSPAQITCANTLCVEGSTCSMENGRPVCRCNTACTKIYQPLCASDNKTYNNFCLMTVAGCQNPELGLYKVRDGRCEDAPPSSGGDDNTSSKAPIKICTSSSTTKKPPVKSPPIRYTTGPFRPIKVD